MTAAAVTAGIAPPGPAWRSLLWLIPLTVLWIVLIAWQPFIPASGVPPSAPPLLAPGILAVGLWFGLESTDLTPDQRRTTWLAVMIPPMELLESRSADRPSSNPRPIINPPIAIPRPRIIAAVVVC